MLPSNIHSISKFAFQSLSISLILHTRFPRVKISGSFQYYSVQKDYTCELRREYGIWVCHKMGCRWQLAQHHCMRKYKLAISMNVNRCAFPSKHGPKEVISKIQTMHDECVWILKFIVYFQILLIIIMDFFVLVFFLLACIVFTAGNEWQ